MTTTGIDQLQELIPGFPDDVALECLSRSHYSSHHLAASVCRRWRHLLHSSDFYRLRRQTGHTHLAACLIQALPGAKPAHDSGPPAFGISLFDSVTQSWERVPSYPKYTTPKKKSHPKYPDRLPLFCHVTSSQGKLILIGGWDPDTYDIVTDVFIYDFRTQKWARGKNMPTKRSLFAIGCVDGRVLIAGGHDKSKDAMDSAWAYSIESDEWRELTRMPEARDECSGLMIGTEFWVISGYETESQGSFKRSADVYDTVTRQWRTQDDVWDTAKSPRSGVGVKGDGGLFSWEGLRPEVQVSTCAVEMGVRALVTGTQRYGAAGEFFLAERSGASGDYGEMRKLDVPDDFKGFVQSACCVEI